MQAPSAARRRPRAIAASPALTRCTPADEAPVDQPELQHQERAMAHSSMVGGRSCGDGSRAAQRTA